MTTLDAAFSNFRTIILKHREHVGAMTKGRAETEAEQPAVTAFVNAYNACFHVISGGTNRCKKDLLYPLMDKRKSFLAEARKLNTCLNNLLPDDQKVITGAMKASATRKVKAARIARIKSIKATWVRGEFSIVKTAHESGHDQDYSHQLHLFQGVLTLQDGDVLHTFPCFKSTTGFYFSEKDIDGKSLNYHRGTSTPKADFVDGRLYL